ncbi:hypothetical protein [Bradyrhizobium sp. CB3481]|uniref:hypothetical protein n=1 Tax=Bradyrhizobium sp. CB3481 TaxID=3039158 RepID=UPI0024B21F09|nr:hypothetical protein [Bradyrhizobium sp. CB3481]WFU13562.1 hypothetical protein QA643_20095 [Bradyrhizobium sp. CB3481]
MRDEAPAATAGGVNERERPLGKSIRRRRRTAFLASGPASFVAAEIHLGHRSAGFSDEPTALQHSSCVPERLDKNIDDFQCVPSMKLKTMKPASVPLRRHNAQ